MAAVGILALAGACHPGRPVKPQPSGDQYLILASELEASHQPTVYEAVRQLRPQWLTRPVGNRTGDDAVAAYVDDQFFGPASSLTRIPTYTALRVRYMAASEAQVRFGQSNALRAAIVVDIAKP